MDCPIKPPSSQQPHLPHGAVVQLLSVVGALAGGVRLNRRKPPLCFLIRIAVYKLEGPPVQQNNLTWALTMLFTQS